MKKSGRAISSFAALGLLTLLILPAVAFAQVNISTAIPGSNINSTSSSPGAFVANFYQFALLIAGILAVGVIAYGGIRYMASPGNPSGQSEAKEWIMGALLGLLLLACAYLILNVINPQLVNLNLPTLNAVTVSNTTISNTTASSSTSTGACAAPTVGACTTSSLASTCFSGNTALWAGICGKESGGSANIKSGSDYCLGPNGTGNYSVSIGLFQINLTNSWSQTVDGQNCSAAFTGQAISCPGGGPCTTGHNGSGNACQISSGQCGSESCMQLYNDCVAAAQVAANNINVACSISNNGSNLGPWKADVSCYSN